MTGPVADPPALEARGLTKRFGRARRRSGPAATVVAGIDLVLGPGEVLGLVGESGGGKSTLARMLAGLERPTAGAVLFRGRPLAGMSRAELRRTRRALGIVLQDPLAALDPRMAIGASVAEPLRIHGEWSAHRGPARVRALLERVGLSAVAVARRPHECSGGERQRIVLARALATEPAVLVLDEPVAALDASVGAGIVNLLADLRAELGLAYIFIGHDLAVVRQISERIAVLHAGAIVEQGPAAAVCARPRHPFTAALISAVPHADPRRERARPRIVLAGEPRPSGPGPGCPFRRRCWHRSRLAAAGADVGACATLAPALSGPADARVACHFPLSGDPYLGPIRSQT